MDVWQQQYINKKLWLSNKYLLEPIKTEHGYTAVKRCMCCGKLKFSVEFADCEMFADRQLPVMTKCYNSRKSDKARDIVKEFGLTKLCKRCLQFKNLAEFGIYKAHNKLYDYCLTCNKNPLWTS